ncbi:MAG TPA: potassium/proton antiporter [Bacteroidales bacterium]|nr:potassium/proton antiporter [Bacteroidales bacterium]
MTITIDNILLIGSILLFISILAGKTSFRLGVPTLIFFVIVGMLAGSEGIGGINFNDPKLTKFIGIIALNFILFAGGFDTDWKTIRPVLSKGITLSTLGVFMTATFLGLFVYLVTDFTLLEGLLLGAIVSSTDAAAVFSILRSKGLGLKGSLRQTLELESGSNDPMAYFLTIMLTMLITEQDKSIIDVIPLFLMQFAFGSLIGLGMGYAGQFIINRIRLDYDGLYPVLVIALMLFTFSAADYINGNGFLAVYLMALYLGNRDLIHKKSLIRAFDGFAWLMQIVLFLTLGLLVFPSDLVLVTGIGLIISLFLIIVARPLSVFISLAFFRMKIRDRFFISWVGLRGAVPIVFATYPLLAGISKAGMIFNIVFFISMTSVLIQGTTLPRVARWLHVTLPEKVRRRTPLDLALSEDFKSEFIEIDITAHSHAAGKQVMALGFPKRSLIVLIKRNGKYLTPNGSTVIEAGDQLVILAEDTGAIDEIRERIEA